MKQPLIFITLILIIMLTIIVNRGYPAEDTNQAQDIVIALDDIATDVVDTYKDVLDKVIPGDNTRLYIRKDEIGISISF